ncbi:malic enzyme-like NAD(P)-binding protein [thiotrophic endosymbiont of Bathymodiolus puteoserpentis (Logatchev)]|jgi:malate dehydrogenase (oxaloacetate-decarboxylating)/malate dehydrogenase (oxaloacetate-decarboxylating)(NADP+)|uniref:malic enzyme-like NAD(P)-binding protein n=1 Tax=thiotrophic endosymbiont of Bathymodiolus puteoserpentis (Logatchev) TaxID=343240 RepID=UPI0010B49654|nr:malic enzyme-like NAD(P)-binding protein [thiotrophic endosymbiont of Bathymodiolus puteoserpentis (Logatchev)]CAC9490371.1 NADP-dependent malic enzyme (EC 1.1.1.40) [uncultured Gammaproteobacteria bacterium]CAC9629189.1 NADP-dependent malic enzyme (EC 1.1.1.40) [uncultured Gammaproteobacteria bacterium]CAC9629567.1 NADP-dependent malic enzyme (EC 1.1.1.40) [uncultured Gammaproteobacteria bacterium]CAC9648614.1 NADP-dependent malic enzyme (EC 1.1.1.40) [uncultured Gammaproteobacteria bacteri
MSSKLHQAALDYHQGKRPGKLIVSSHKPLETREDLSLAYTPGVAAPVREIANNPALVDNYTIKNNLVAVISDGSAVLGLGNVGPLASKPVMEGKAVLFKKFADIDVFDIEVDTQDVDEFVQTVKNIAPTFGGINLEDISAPRCFEIEQRLIETLDIPVFHDDQHGTAIIIAAGLLNALEIQGKIPENATLTCLGAGAAGIATLDLLCELGFQKTNILLVDSKGVINNQREDLTKEKLGYVSTTNKQTLADAMQDCDVFVGVASANLVSKGMVKSMADNPIVFALSNPDPEISPADANSVRDDLIMATGRSDYPNQVNNVLGFPFIFRGALDAKASTINIEMKIAAVYALKDLAKLEVPAEVLKAYNADAMSFSKGYIIPKPFDKRLIDVVPKAVFNAAVASGVSRL